jgi:hypothetical protein
MEYAELGSLRSQLDMRESGSAVSCLDDTGVAIIVCGIVHGMDYLHHQGIVRRDLRPENIFLYSFGHVKLEVSETLVALALKRRKVLGLVRQRIWRRRCLKDVQKTNNTQQSWMFIRLG